MIRPFIDNLAWMQASIGNGEYLTLPASFETAQALFKRLDLADGKHDLEILEYETDIPGLAKCLSQYDNLDELNYLASLLDDMDEAGRVKFAAAVEHGEYTGEVAQLINLAQNLDCYDLHPDITSFEDLGRLRAEGRFTLPDDCRFYFDYEQYGEDTSINEGGVFSQAGYICNNGSFFTEHYNGRDMPEQYRLFARPQPEIETSGQLGPKSGKEVENSMIEASAAPLAENEHVKELLAILRENNSPSTKDFLAVLQQVGAMEKQLDAAVKELAAMRRELQEAQEQNHPVKTAMQKAVIAMQGQVLDLRDKLAELKQNVIDGCKSAVAAFKEKGISALDNITRFFKVKPLLENMRDTLNDSIKHDDKAIARIEAVSAEYHEAGRHVGNIGRAMMGKEAVQDVKPVGKLAKALEAPFRAERSCFVSMKKSVEAAIGSLARLEERAAERKPSIKQAMQTFNEQIAQAKKDAPAVERPRPAAAHDR